MASNTPRGLTFDFNRAAAAARRDYPEETRNITFIDTSQPGAADQLVTWIADTDPAYQKLMGVHFISPALVAEILIQSFDGNFSMKDPVTGKGVLLSRPSGKIFNTLSPFAAAAAAFDHELGHLVAEGGMLETLAQMAAGRPADASHDVEIRADLFAALRGVQQGYLDRSGIEKMAAFRTSSHDITHDSSHVLESVLKEKDALKDLDPRKVKALTRTLYPAA